jgi:hypothetical protein
VKNVEKKFVRPVIGAVQIDGLSPRGLLPPRFLTLFSVTNALKPFLADLYAFVEIIRRHEAAFGLNPSVGGE